MASHQDPSRRRALLFVAATILLWGSHGPMGKHLVDRLAWPVVIFANTTFALLFLVVFCALTGRMRQMRTYTAKQLGQLALAGAFGVAVYYALLFYSFSTHVYAMQFQVLNYLFPVMTVLFAAALVPGERLSVQRLASVLLAFFGAYWVLTRGNPAAFRLTHWRGDLAALGAAASYGLFSALGKRFRYEPVSGMLVFFLVGNALLVPVLLATPAMGMTLRLPRGPEWLGLAYIGMASNGLGTLCWLSALRAGDTALVGSLVYLAVFVALGLFHVFLGEPVGPHAILGTVFVVAGADLPQLVRLARSLAGRFAEAGAGRRRKAGEARFPR